MKIKECRLRTVYCLYDGTNEKEIKEFIKNTIETSCYKIDPYDKEIKTLLIYDPYMGRDLELAPNKVIIIYYTNKGNRKIKILDKDDFEQQYSVVGE